MIKLYGAPLSAFYNKVKIALLEKGVRFEEVLTRPSQDAALLAKSPMGKIPFVEIGSLHLSESTAILEWLEDAYPTATLLPPTPNGRALARQIMLMFDLYVVPACAPVQRHKLFGAPLEQAGRDAVQTTTIRALTAIAQLAQMRPYLCGEDFSYADLAAASALPMVQFAAAELGVDLLAALPGADDYLRVLASRRSVATVWAGREQAVASLLAQEAAKG